MSKYFKRTFRVGWSEANAIGQLRLSEYFRYVIETAWDWGATVGLSIAESQELGLAWILHEAELNLYRPLYPNDVFDLTIWLVNWRRVRGTRCFEIVLNDGKELVAQGTQEVVSLDLNTFRPVATPEYIIDQLRMENPRVVPHQKFPKLQTQREAPFVVQRTVEWRDLDSQEHVNHANYVAFAEDSAAQVLASVGWSPAYFKSQGLTVVNKRVQIQYQTSASWGETLDVMTSLVELNPTGGAWHIEIARASDGEPVAQCMLDWSLANRNTGEEQTLPKSLSHMLEKKVGIPGAPP